MVEVHFSLMAKKFLVMVPEVFFYECDKNTLYTKALKKWWKQQWLKTVIMLDIFK